jgi:prepilin-type N-terminal cleavage/methylation domain-containing protein
VTARRQRQAGFTLVELLVGMAIMSIVSLALAGTFLVGYRTISQEARQIAADQAVSSASLPLLRDLSSATTISTSTITTGSGTLTVTYGTPITTVTYGIDSKNNLIRTVGASAKVASRGMQRVTVALPSPACYYTVTLTPSATGAVAVNLNMSSRVGPQGCF